MMNTKLPLKKISRLVARHLKQNERGRNLLQTSDVSLDAAMSLGAPLDIPIDLPADKTGIVRRVVLRDQFARKNQAFSSKIFQRYKVEDWKEPKA